MGTALEDQEIFRKLTPTQWRFLLDRTARIKLFSGGLGSGKTTTGAATCISEVFDNPPGTEFMMVAPTMPMFERFMRPTFERLLPPGFLVAHQASRSRYLLKDDRIMHYGSAERPASLEGSNLAGFWGDEVRYWRREAWDHLIARLRDVRATSLRGIATSTPAMGWMEEEFNRGREGRLVIRIGTRENAHNLAAGYVEDLERSYSPRLCSQVLDGEFVLPEGQVFESFDPRRHLVDWTVNPALRTTIWMDFGVRRSSVLFAQHLELPHLRLDAPPLPGGSIIVFDELQPEQLSTERVIQRIAERLERHGLGHRGRDGQFIHNLTAIFCDPAGSARDIASGEPSVHLLTSAFGKIVRYQTAHPYTWIPNGIEAVEGMLNPSLGEPRLYIARRLAEPTPRTSTNDPSRGIVPTLKGYQYLPIRDGRTLSDTPKKDGYYEHCADALRYGVVNTLLAEGRRVGTQHIGLIHGQG
jgi:hypothetical protein